MSLTGLTGTRSCVTFAQRLAVVMLALVANLLGDVASFARPATVNVEARAEDGFGRIVLTFVGRQALPDYQADVRNGVLVVEFAESIAANVDRVSIELGDFITVSRTDPDGRALRFALARAVKVNTMEAGERLFIDLMPHDWVGRPPGLPESVVAELAERARRAAERARIEMQRRLQNGEISTVDFSLGRHPTFSRFSFRWTGPYLASFSRHGDTVAVEFDNPGEIDLAPVRANLPPGVVEVAAENVDGSLRFTLRIAANTAVRAFRDGDTYVVDVTDEENAADEGKRELSALRPNSEKVPPGSTEIRGGEGRETPAEHGNSAPGPTSPRVATVPLDPAEMAKGTDEANGNDGAVAGPAIPAMAGNLPGPVDESAGSGGPALSRQGVVDGGVDGGDEAAAPPAPSAFLRAEVRRIGNSVRLIFPFENETAAAVFRRGKALWLVFDTAMPIDVRTIRSDLGALIREISAKRRGDWQTLRIDFAESHLTTIATEDTNWIVTIGDRILAPSRPLTAKRALGEDGSSLLRIPFTDGGSVHWIKDEKVGDRIVAVTGLGPPRGFLRSLDLVDLSILPSAHGVALIPKIDDLIAEIDSGAITISSGTGLALSHTPFRKTGPVTLGGRQPNRAGLIDFASWQVDGAMRFRARRMELQDILTSLTRENRGPARLDLIRFLVANGYAFEALGQIAMAQQDNPRLHNDPGLLVHQAAANVIANRMKDALDVLNGTAIENDPDARVWRLLANAGLHRWSEVRHALPKVVPLLSTYPATIQADVYLAGIEASIEANDFATAITLLAEIDPARVPPRQAQRYAILEARIVDANGEADKALALYDRIIETGDRRYAAEALFRKLSQMQRDDQLNAAEGITALEHLTTVWRGDDIELQSLALLSDLYVRSRKYRDAFRTMRTATRIAPDSDTTRLLQDRMSDVFAELFLEGKADDLAPLEALALFYDYRELTPIGRRGDEMVRRLAERLVGVDLLEQAEKLLAHQVENRLRGAARAEVAADLAVIYLMDRKPSEALRVLHQTRLSRLPEIMERRRRLVEARALAATGRTEIAIDLLKPFEGPDIDRARADILWAGKRWQQAGEQIERMYTDRWSSAETLSDEERIDLIRAAIAFALAGDRIGLGRLRTKYAEKMAQGPYARAFDVVTGPVEASGVEFQAVVREIAAIDTLEAFLSEYRTHYAEPERQPESS